MKEGYNFSFPTLLHFPGELLLRAYRCYNHWFPCCSACIKFHPTCSFFHDCCVAWRALRAGQPPDLEDDRILAPQSRTDTPISKHTKLTHIWLEPQVLEAVGSKIRLVNTSKSQKPSATMSAPARSHPS